MSKIDSQYRDTAAGCRSRGPVLADGRIRSSEAAPAAPALATIRVELGNAVTPGRRAPKLN
jgi:hypothetical protein